MKSTFRSKLLKLARSMIQDSNFVASILLLICCVALLGCGSTQETPAREQAAESAVTAPAETEQSETSEEPADAAMPAAAPSNEEKDSNESSSAAGSQTDTVDHEVTYSDTVWAPGHEQKLMLGLDGGEYEPYRAPVVREAQRELKSEGFYDGSVSGIIDEQTMEAIGEFQRQNGLPASGVLSPLTRQELFGEAAAPDEVS